MKTAGTVLLFLVLIACARCYRAPSEPPEPRDEEAEQRIVLSAIEMLSAERDSELIESFYYPEPAAREKEARGLQRHLDVLQETFGGISVVGPYRGLPSAHFVGIAAGSPDFWARNPHMRRFNVSVDFQRQGSGWIFVDVSQFDGKATLRSISYALPTGKEGSARLIYGLGFELNRTVREEQ